MIGNNRKEIDVFIQDSTSPFFRYFFTNEQKDDILLTAPTAVNDEIIPVSAGHGFTAAAGEVLVMWHDNRYTQSRVKSVSTNNITITTPVAKIFPVDGTKVIRGNINMHIDGSSTPVDFLVKIQNFTIPIDISSVIFTMFHAAVPDDGTFGGIAALTNGLWFRAEKMNGAMQFNLATYKNNQDFKNIGAHVEYTAKGPGGINATNVFVDLRGIFGQVVRLDPRTNDFIRGQVRDNLTGLVSLTTTLIGSYTSGE